MRVKKTLSVDTDFLDKAETLRSLLRYPDVSSLVEQLIREEWERRQGPLRLSDGPPPTAPAAPETAVNYKKPLPTAGATAGATAGPPAHLKHHAKDFGKMKERLDQSKGRKAKT